MGSFKGYVLKGIDQITTIRTLDEEEVIDLEGIQKLRACINDLDRKRALREAKIAFLPTL